jgi:hypothetical protein
LFSIQKSRPSPNSIKEISEKEKGRKEMEKIYLGIDVGTNSVRVGAFNQKGTMRGKGLRGSNLRLTYVLFFLA